jgi:5-(carboxyamino)imidazole ribonucleotide synthase
LGILGGGQLGRMTAMAAARLGIQAVIWTPETDSPASHVAAETIVAPWDNEAALGSFAEKVDVVTLEFENVPLPVLRRLEARVPVRPGARSLEVSQDRLLEKDFANERGIATAPFRAVASADDLSLACQEIGTPAILKTRRMGYDGKGQVRINDPSEAPAAWQNFDGAPCVLEGYVDFVREISVIVARSESGVCCAFDVVENQHENHILRRTISPAAVSDGVAKRAIHAGERLAAALDLIGLLAVEFFHLADDTLIVNEIAPRPHNSGHWTIDACHVSQFEQLVRAVVGLPLGDPARHSNAEMVNLLGDEATDAWRELEHPYTCLHLYGKAEAHPGRKMGHLTRLLPRT